MNQNGVYLTAGLLLLMLAAMSLAQSAFIQQDGLEKAQSPAIAMDRLDYKHQNIEENISGLLETASGISWDSNSRVAMFTETLPNKARTTTYSGYFNAYRQFAQLNSDGFDVNIRALPDSATLSIWPYDINYTHLSTSQKKNPKPNQVVFSPASVDFNSYIVDMVLSDQDYQDTTAQIKSTKANPICLQLRVYKDKKKENLDYQNTWCDIDPQKTSTVTVKTNGASPNDVQVRVSAVGILTITNNNNNPITLGAGVDFGPSAQSAPQVTLPAGMIAVSEPSLGIQRQ